MGRPPLRPQPEYGAHLAKLREAAGLTQKQLATKLGVPVSNITFWERSPKPPRSEMLVPIAKALGVSTDVLLRAKVVAIKERKARGRLHELFEAAAKLPRRQQQKVVDLLEPFVSQHANGGS